jgi:two-component system, NtrC family, sensor histidine kinase HydH
MGSLRIIGARRENAIEVTVEDDGVGMNARTRERALDGFFTTKIDGSGLGLAFVRRVIDAHAGSLVVTSQEGRGARVVVTLPQ